MHATSNSETLTCSILQWWSVTSSKSRAGAGTSSSHRLLPPRLRDLPNARISLQHQPAQTHGRLFKTLSILRQIQPAAKALPASSFEHLDLAQRRKVFGQRPCVSRVGQGDPHAIVANSRGIPLLPKNEHDLLVDIQRMTAEHGSHAQPVRRQRLPQLAEDKRIRNGNSHNKSYPFAR